MHASLDARPRVVILGAGPAGVGAAFQLARRGQADVTVLERNAVVGGNAGSFELAGMRVDYGSHRLHPACDPTVMRDIRALLGADLLDRPRHGRIRLRGRWIHFPLKPVDLALRLPPDFALGVASDLTRKLVRRRRTHEPETFASVLEAGLGRTICHDFYFPYALKVWGLDPEELSGVQARRRVGASSLTKMARKVLAAVPGLKPPGSGRFFYPRHGYGQITEAYAEAAQAHGADVRFGASVREVALADHGRQTVTFEHQERLHRVEADHVWSTIPVTALARLLRPAAPADFLEAAERLDYRAMILVYLVLDQERFSEFDAHYFPELNVRITRLSEPKNYADAYRGSGRTVLCAELPCSPEDPEWGMSDDELGMSVCEDLKVAGIPVRAPIRQVATRRLRYAYPVYRRGYEAPFEALDRWVEGLDGVLTFGRQGLFAHDNTHHALYMAYCAAECLSADGCFDRDRWRSYRRVFESHVVED